MMVDVASTVAQNCLRVFVVEDSALLRHMLIETLTDIGCLQVTGYAADEAAALEQLRTSPADLVVVDIELRRGSGLGVLEALQRDPAQYHRARPVVLSNHSHASIRKRCEALGCVRFFDKSIEVDQLVAFVRQQINHAATRASLA